jgi:hypothetical protein
MTFAHDLNLLPLVMVIGNLVRLGLAAPALADSADLHNSVLPYPPPLPPPQGGRGTSSHNSNHNKNRPKNCPSPLEGEGREGGKAGHKPLFGCAPSRMSPHLALRGAP